MEPGGSVTHWIERLRSGERDAAAQAIWERYFEKLVRCARRKLGDFPRRVEEEEDVALSAFESFFEGARKGRFPDLGDREELWRLLLWIAARKAVDRIRHYGRQKRRVKGESVLVGGGSELDAERMDRVIGDSPTPEFAAIMVEEYRRLLDSLQEPRLKRLAVAKMEGRTNEAIAEELGCSLRTVERQLNLIRKMWEEAAPS